jgi:hypothetical protein
MLVKAGGKLGGKLERKRTEKLEDKRFLLKNMR